jgi:hypothetical protein
MKRAIKLLAAARTGTVAKVGEVRCYDGGGSDLYGLQFDKDGNTMRASFLRSLSCRDVLHENDSAAARRLGLWVDQLRHHEPAQRAEP